MCYMVSLYPVDAKRNKKLLLRGCFDTLRDNLPPQGPGHYDRPLDEGPRGRARSDALDQRPVKFDRLHRQIRERLQRGETAVETVQHERHSADHAAFDERRELRRRL